jgi:HlyD family secretion protein
MLRSPFWTLGVVGSLAAGAGWPDAALARSVTATGVLKPISTVTLGTNVSGSIQELSCEVNANVRRGQICARIDPRPYQRALEASRAELATAIAQLEQHAAGLAQAKAAYQRNATLLERGVVTKASYEGLESLYKQALAQIELDKAVIEQRKAQLATAELNLGYTQIVSPIDGVVLDRRIQVGETVSANFQSPALFVVASDLTRMHAVVRINETDIGAFRSADKAKLIVKAFPNQKFSGKVHQIRYVPEAAGNVVSYEVLIDVENIELYLRPGMSVAVEIDVTG